VIEYPLRDAEIGAVQGMRLALALRIDDAAGLVREEDHALRAELAPSWPVAARTISSPGARRRAPG